jgi:hypothetical protein
MIDGDVVSLLTLGAGALLVGGGLLARRSLLKGADIRQTSLFGPEGCGYWTAQARKAKLYLDL